MIALGTIYFISKTLRGVSRSFNPTYCQFIRQFKLATTPLNAEHRNDDLSKQIIDARNVLREKYDFEFQHWPVDFNWSDGKYINERPAKLLPVQEASNETLIDGPVMNMVSYFMANSIARMLLYPGSVGILHKILEKNLVQGRNYLIENFNAKRYKLLARDNNQIDTIFIDKRNNNLNSHGNILVITCEGNAGFYEIGCMTTPLNLNYSILGWNHPGFFGSTGLPFPQNDINAMEVVVNFAVTELNFKLENIMIFAWSIGGFPAAWAVSNYPELKGLILDASFDDVLPLAKAKMMPFLGPIVDSTIRNYFNLNVSSYLNRYPGPIRLIRRLRDEIIQIDPNRPLITNRGNNILIKLLQARFPNLMSNEDIADEVEQFVHTQNYTYLLSKVDDVQVVVSLSNYIKDNNVQSFPINIGLNEITISMAQQIVLFMVSNLIIKFNLTKLTLNPLFFGTVS